MEHKAAGQTIPEPVNTVLIDIRNSTNHIHPRVNVTTIYHPKESNDTPHSHYKNHFVTPTFTSLILSFRRVLPIWRQIPAIFRPFLLQFWSSYLPHFVHMIMQVL